jgi:hypothetical protein
MQSSHVLFKKNVEKIILQPPQKIQLKAYPPKIKICFDLLNSAGGEYYALFGGAIRDADYAARHQANLQIKDYDIRLWLPADNFAEHEKNFLHTLSTIGKTLITSQACPGTNHLHYCFDFQEIELDLSIRPIPASFQNKIVPVEAVAIDRASESDVAISAVAIDPSGSVWARSEYLMDQDNKTLTVYEIHDLTRRSNYANRMKNKFPEHVVVGIPEEEMSAPTKESGGVHHQMR